MFFLNFLFIFFVFVNSSYAKEQIINTTIKEQTPHIGNVTGVGNYVYFELNGSYFADGQEYNLNGCLLTSKCYAEELIYRTICNAEILSCPHWQEPISIGGEIYNNDMVSTSLIIEKAQYREEYYLKNVGYKYVPKSALANAYTPPNSNEILTLEQKKEFDSWTHMRDEERLIKEKEEWEKKKIEEYNKKNGFSPH